MNPINYSVIIRTTGLAGIKYQTLLNCIANLKPFPNEIIVVLPDGYSLPKEQLGCETFVFCPKGMVTQRLYGIAKCTTPYALVCDDDISFNEDFVRKIYKPIEEGVCKISSGPLYSFLPQKGAKAFISFLSGASSPTIFHKNRYVSILRTAGYSYNRYLDSKKQKYYEAQSLAWTCFFADVESLRKIELEQEIWLDARGYAAYDDQTMFYKAWLRNIRTVVVPDAIYIHNDAKTSTKNNKSNVIFALSYNRIIFWHRFIYSVENNCLLRLWTSLAFFYRNMWDLLFAFLYYLRGRYTKEDFVSIKMAHEKAKEYIKSTEYKNLSPVK